MTLLLSLHSEILKTRKTASWYICFLIAALAPFVSFIDFYEQAPEDIALKFAKGNVWEVFLMESFQIMNMVFLPLFVIMLCTVLPQLEYRNNTWKQVMTSPQPKWRIFVAKYANVLMFILLFVAIHNFLIMSVAVLLDYAKPVYKFHSQPIPWMSLLVFNCRTIVCILALSAVQFWAGLRFRNFIAPIGLGFFFWLVAAHLAFESRSEYADLHPFTYPIFCQWDQFASKLKTLMLGSVGYWLFFLSIGFLDFRNRRFKD